MQRLGRLFERYSDAHLVRGRRNVPILTKGRLIGYVERLEARGVQRRLQGWTIAEEIRTDAGRPGIIPQTLREDVRARHGIDARAFDLTMSGEEGLHLLCDGEWHPVAMPPLPRRRLARALLALRFAADLTRALPLIARWRRTRDPALRRAVRDRLLGPQPGRGAADLPPGLFGSPGQAPPDTPVTIVLPFHNAFDVLQDCLDRLALHTDLDWHLIVVEDASTDPRVRPWLREWCAGQGDRVTLLENNQNLGFIGSVNRAFAVAVMRGAHVILLNSDALVPRGWASRLIAPICADDGVASVTPFSNDAEIFTAPAICRPVPLGAGEAEAMDRVARQLGAAAAVAEAATGVGFCMAMNLGFLRQIPAFDTAFGRGYGEEVDWCQKARQRGGRHLGTASLFVEHRGGGSFGSEAKQRLLAENGARVAARYPRYDAEVRGFIDRDPLAGARLALGLGRAGSQGVPIPVFVAHSLGGGAELYLRHRLRREPSAVVLRVGGPRRWQFELHCEAGMTAACTDDTAQVRRLLHLLPAMRLIYSCAVGDPDPAAIPETLLSFLREGDGAEILFHDYFPISPSYTLLDSAGLWRGVPQPSDPDAAHRLGAVSLPDWRARWAKLVARADTLVAFSQASADIIAAAFPGAAGAISVTPHDLPVTPAAISPPTHGRTVAVPGNIGAQKGARLLAPLGRALAARGITLMVMGTVDPAIALAPGTPVTGPYRPEDIGRIARRHRIAAWLIPSIWPETFSYTTHESLATGLPTFVLDLGAQAEAASRAPNGRVVPFDPSDPAPAVVAAILRELAPRFSGEEAA
ncbi:glycosyltransferase [Halodurantibacterium flavum]|uniref:Glycosyltransferase n=1 Tax=Halodurantibacterium flavum TaxID=1382802 RepID=A0ABW4S775_9RHOB